MELVPLSVLQLDHPEPADGWAVELRRRGVEVALDDLGRASIPRAAARDLLAERREEEDRRVRHHREVEARAVEADRRFRAQLPRGIPVDAVPPGISPGMLMCASDPLREGPKRETMLEHALANPSGSIILHSIEGKADYQSGGES